MKWLRESVKAMEGSAQTAMIGEHAGGEQLINMILSGPNAWILSLVILIFAVAWAFAGARSHRTISLLQGSAFGGVLGTGLGLILPGFFTNGSFSFQKPMEGSFFLTQGLWPLAGFIIGAALFGWTGRFWIRILFWGFGAAFGMVLFIGLIRIFQPPLQHPILWVLFVAILVSAAVLWASFRFPVVFTGIWGGIWGAAGFFYPTHRLLLLLNSPFWLTFLAAGGLGVLLAIAGTAWQLDHQGKGKNQHDSYRQEVHP